MRIDVEKLAASGLSLRWDEERVVELGPSGALTGSYESTPEALRIRAGASHALSILGFRWLIGGAVLEGLAPARAEQARVDLSIGRGARPSSGSINAGRLRAGALELKLAGATSGPILVEGLSAETVRIELGKDGTSIEAGRLSIDRLKLPLAGAELVAEGLELADVRVRGRHVEVAAVRAASLALEVPALAALLPKRGAKKARQKPLDLALLDQLSGKLDVDLTADATVPVIGRRRATHHFRIPIADGAIDFKKLERNLATLEDAVLDFELRGNKLCLEKDLPLVPFDNKSLVEWKLDDGDVELAKRKRVRLRRLAEPRVIGSDAPAASRQKKPSSFALRSLHFDGIEADLKLRGPVEWPLGDGSLTLGDGERPPFAALELSGAVHYDVSGKSAATELGLDLKKLRLGLEQLALGSLLLDLDAVGVAGLSATVGLSGLVPGLLRVTARDVSLAAARLRPR